MKILLAVLFIGIFIFTGCSKDHIESEEDSRVATCGMLWKDIITKYGINDTTGLDVHTISPIENKKTILSGLKHKKFWVAISNDSTHNIFREWTSIYNFDTQRTIEEDNELLTIPNITIKESIITDEGVVFSIPLNARYNSYHDLCFIQDDKMNLVQNVKCHFIKQWYKNSIITGLDAEKDPTITTRYNGFVFFNNGTEYYTLPFYFTRFLPKLDMINYFEGIINLGEVSQESNQLEVVSNNNIISKYNFADRVENWRVELSDYIECENFTIHSNLIEVNNDIAKFEIALIGTNNNDRIRGLSINTSTGEVNLNPISIEKIELIPSSVEIAINDIKKLEYKITPMDATEKFTWETSDPKIVAIKNDTIKGISEGEAVVSLKTTNGVIATCDVKVKRIHVENIEILPSNLQLGVNEHLTIVANIIPSNATNKNITWTTNDDSVVKIENIDKNECSITGLKEGVATITCTTEDGDKVAICNVNVKPILAESIKFDFSSITTYTGQICNFNAKLIPSNTTNKNIIWTYNYIDGDHDLIKIDNNGNITITGSQGSVFVKATSGDGNASQGAYLIVKPIHEFIEIDALVQEINVSYPIAVKIQSSIKNPTSYPIEILNVMLMDDNNKVEQALTNLGQIQSGQSIVTKFNEMTFDNIEFDALREKLRNYIVRYQIRIDGEVKNIETNIRVFD